MSASLQYSNYSGKAMFAVPLWNFNSRKKKSKICIWKAASLIWVVMNSSVTQESAMMLRICYSPGIKECFSHQCNSLSVEAYDRTAHLQEKYRWDQNRHVKYLAKTLRTQSCFNLLQILPVHFVKRELVEKANVLWTSDPILMVSDRYLK